MTNLPEERMFCPISESPKLRCTTGEPGKVFPNPLTETHQPPTGGLEMLKRIDREIERTRASEEALNLIWDNGICMSYTSHASPGARSNNLSRCCLLK